MASTLLNLAEGNGKALQGKERRRFFHIALGSIAEVAACLDLMREFSLIEPQIQRELKAGLRKCYYQIRKLP
jgi:four helix bundle protein